MASGNLTAAEIQRLLESQSGNYDDTDFISDIQELKRQLVKEVRKNHHLERNISKVEGRIALLIQNRTSIQEIDRQIKRKKIQKDSNKNQGVIEDFTQNKKLMEGYSNFFYALQVEPKYLARIAYVTSAEHTEQFVELLLLTLYGDAYSPREEYLILQLFKHAMEYEMKHLRDVSDFIQSDTVVPKMVLTYNKRKQGVDYIKNTFQALFTDDIMVNDYQFEMKPFAIYQKLINDKEVREGQKSKVKRDIGSQEAARDPEVKQIIESRTKDLQEVCGKLLERALDTISSMPYGLRLICKQIRTLLISRFPSTKPDMIWKVIGYFVYYRFIGLAIVAPDSFDIGDRNLSPIVRKNLISVSKVLFQLMFRLEPFSPNDEFAPLSPWIEENRKQVIEYYSELIDVPPPEDYLNVNQYMELTQQSKPLIIISLSEIVLAHRLVKDAIGAVVTDENDPLRVIISNLGEVPSLPEGGVGDRDIQLQLENAFKDSIDGQIEMTSLLYAETKRLIIEVFKVVPIKAGSIGLKSIIKSAGKYAVENSNKQLKKNVDRILSNLEVLQNDGVISKEDRYVSLLKDVAIEVANRGERKEAEMKELMRLKATLKNVKRHQDFMANQMGEFEKYLESCRRNSAARAKTKSKPLKLSFKDLVKRKVIIDSNIQDMVEGSIKFFISMTEVGIFDIEAKFGPSSIAKMRLELDDLLEKKENSIDTLEIDQITLSVPNTIYLINKNFLC